jgi:hypothetical protein
MASSDLYDAAHEFFNVCLAALADTRGGQPECAYIAEGPPAWDSCPCLICWVGGPAVGDTFPLQPALAPMHRFAVGQVNVVSFTALSLRCAAELSEGGGLPTPAEHETAAAQVADDMWAMWNHLLSAKRHGTLFPPKEREFSLEPTVAVNPAGGAAGAQMTVRVQLDGYDPFAGP